VAELSNFIANYQAQFWSIALVVFGFVLERTFRLKPRLRYSIGHSWNMLVDQPLLGEDGKELAKTQVVRSASITVFNSGLQPARSVEITFNWKPIFNVWPARSFEEATSAFGRYSIKLGSLAPKEQFVVEIMAINAELPNLTTVRCEDCEGKLVAMSLQRLWPSWFLSLVGVIMIIGAAGSLYLTILGLQALTDTPKAKPQPTIGVPSLEPRKANP
jgi:hypothetical protein